MKNNCIFKGLFAAADKYLKKSSWKDMALLKFCLCAIGILIGLNVTSDKRKCVKNTAIFVFIVTYIPLMAKFLPFLLDEFSASDTGSDNNCCGK